MFVFWLDYFLGNYADYNMNVKTVVDGGIEVESARTVKANTYVFSQMIGAFVLCPENYLKGVAV